MGLLAYIKLCISHKIMLLILLWNIINNKENIYPNLMAQIISYKIKIINFLILIVRGENKCSHLCISQSIKITLIFY